MSQSFFLMGGGGNQPAPPGSGNGIGIIACRGDISSLVGNGSELQVVLFIPEIFF